MNGYRFPSVAGEDLVFDAPELKEATRMLDLGPVFGVACHTCEMKGDKLVSQHRGLAKDEDSAFRWLAGEDVEVRPVFPLRRIR